MALNLPKISIVTPSFNQGKYIEQTIRSVLEQGYPQLEYIIIDGGSTDETPQIIRKYEKYLTYWVSEPDRGQSHAINKGLQKCTGQVFNWLNSDDFLEPGSLYHIGQKFALKSYAVLCGRVNVWDDTVFSHVRKPSYLGPTTEDSIAAFNINQEGTWWNLDLIKSMGGVNENLHYCMDLELWFRLLLSAPISSFRQTDTILSNFRRHPEAKSTAQGLKGDNSPFLLEQLRLFEALKPDETSWSFFELSDFVNNQQGVKLIHFKASSAQKKIIANKRLFALMQANFNQENFTRAKKAGRMLGCFPRGVNTSDFWYLKRKCLFSEIRLPSFFSQEGATR